MLRPDLQLGVTINCPKQHDISYSTAVTEPEYNQSLNSQNTSPFLCLTGCRWVIYCEDLVKNWPRYNGITLYQELIQYMAAYSLARCITRSSATITVTVYTLALVCNGKSGKWPTSSQWQEIHFYVSWTKVSRLISNFWHHNLLTLR